jgi:hypothetical protein
MREYLVPMPNFDEPTETERREWQEANTCRECGQPNFDGKCDCPVCPKCSDTTNMCHCDDTQDDCDADAARWAREGG